MTIVPPLVFEGERFFYEGHIMDVTEIVRILSKELRDYSLRKRKYIEKPRRYRLPLKHRRCTLKQLRAKYPDPPGWQAGRGIHRLLRTHGDTEWTFYLTQIMSLFKIG